MNKLTKDQKFERDRLVLAMREQHREVEAAVNKYNDVAREAAEFVAGIVDVQEEYASDRSDAWQDGDRGQAYALWQEAFDDARGNLENEVEVPSEIEEMIEAVEKLPESPEEA